MADSAEVVMEGVREYAEGMPVTLHYFNHRPVIAALNEAGHNGTDVDLLDLLAWLRTHAPELLKETTDG